MKSSNNSKTPTSPNNSKTSYAFLSVVLAFLFWLYVIDVEDPERSHTFKDVPITLIGENVLESQNLTVTALSHDTVDLEIAAPISTLNTLLSAGLTVSLDVSKLSSEGDFSTAYTVNLPNNVNSNTLILEQRTPTQISVEVGKLYSESFPIGLVMRGSVAEGYQAGQHTTNPETVILNGTVEAVSKVDRVVVVLEQENLDERFSGELPLLLLDTHGQIIDDINIDMSETSAFVTLPIVMEREIPLVVNCTPGGGATEDHISQLEISPQTITVSGAEEAIIGLKEISLGTIDLSLVREQKTFTFPIALDSSLSNVSGISEASVTVTVEGLATQTFDITNIELINIEPGYTASTSTQMRTVVVRGAREDLALLDASQLRIVADLSDISASGSTSVPVRVYLDSALDVGVTGEYTIVVNIAKN